MKMTTMKTRMLLTHRQGHHRLHLRRHHPSLSH
jgi:hypothetical protein